MPLDFRHRRGIEFPVAALSPLQIGAFVNPGAPAATRWTGNNVFAFADQIHVLLGEPRPLEVFYLRGAVW